MRERTGWTMYRVRVVVEKVVVAYDDSSRVVDNHGTMAVYDAGHPWNRLAAAYKEAERLATEAM